MSDERFHTFRGSIDAEQTLALLLAPPPPPTAWHRPGEISSARRILMGFNRILGMADRLADEVRDERWQPLFIVGSPRSGTTLTYQLITQQLRCVYLPRLLNYSYGATRLQMRLLCPLLGRPAAGFRSSHGRIPGLLSPGEHPGFWSRWLPVHDPEAFYEADPSALNLQAVAGLAGQVHAIMASHDRPLVVKCLYLGPFVGLLAALFPGARFLFVERQRLQTCQSLLLTRLRQPDPFRWWSLKVPGYRDLLCQPLWRQIAEQVVLAETLIRKALERHAADRFRVIRYEMLCQEPAAVLTDLRHWLTPLQAVWYPEQRFPQQFTVSDQPGLPTQILALLEAYLANKG